MTPIENLISRVTAQWAGLTSGQRLVLLSMVASFVISALVFTLWLRKPDMSVLASGLDASSAGDVIQALDDRGVAYQVTDGGRTVLVDRDMVSELRVFLASGDILSASPIGYELFDNEKIGITEFAQKINLQRALEGELARTITELKAVTRARVHIAIPKETVFADEENLATASVILKLKPGHDLTGRQIQGIANLVSFSIDGLDASRVSIVDDNGNVLKGDASDQDGGNVAQLEEQRSIEGYLAAKAEQLLSEVVGYDNAKVAVNAALNWEQIQRTKESYDPTKTVVRSEERNESTSPADGSTTESSITNYEVDKTIEQVLSAVGTIKRLSIAVFVDHAPVDDGNGDVTYAPRSDDELQKLEDIVKNAVGFDASRGDNVSVVNMRFSEDAPLLQDDGFFASPVMQMLPSLLGKVAMIAIVLILLLKIRKQLKFAPPPARTTLSSLVDAQGRGVRPEDMVDIEVNPEDLSRASIEDQARRVAVSNPENVAKLMKNWMVDEANV